MVSMFSTSNNISIYQASIPELDSNIDYRIWFYFKPSRSYYATKMRRLAGRYQLRIVYDMSNDSYNTYFQPLTRSDVSAQIFGSPNPPYGNCARDCLRVRFTQVTDSVKDNIPRINYLNSNTMMHIPDIKFTFSSYIILIMGIIGLFSDVTAINTIEYVLSLLYKLIDIVKLVTHEIAPTSMMYQMVIHSTLGILCLLHVIHITIVYQKYDIQSTMNEGLAPVDVSDISVKICVKHISTEIHDMVPLKNFNGTERISMLKSTIDDFLIFNSSNSIKYSTTNDKFICMESNGYKNFDTSILVLIYWRLIDLVNAFNKLLDSETYNPYYRSLLEVQFTMNPIDRGLFYQSPTFRIHQVSNINEYSTLYIRGEFLEYPYPTACALKHSQNRLKCLEQKYILTGRSEKWGKKLTIEIKATKSIGIKVLPSMTTFDYISCVSTILGFWLGLSIAGVAEIFITRCCARSVILFIGKIIIWSTLSILLSYFIVSRFQEYFHFDVSSDLRFMDTPNGMVLPPFILYTQCVPKKFDPNITVSQMVPNPKWWVQHPNISCSLYNLCHHMSNVSIVDAENLTRSNYFHARCYTTIATVQIVSITSDGSWNSKEHKYILVPKRYQSQSTCKVYDIEHTSESVVTLKPKDDFKNHQNANLRQYQIAHSFLNNHNILFEYSYSKLLEAPYTSDCQEHRDPESDPTSWYRCMINRTMYLGMRTRKIVTSCEIGSPTYYSVRSPGDSLNVEYWKEQCIKEANLHRPCQSWSSHISYPVKDRDLFPGNIVLEPGSTVTYVLSPKIRSVDFFILLLDLVGFWLGFNFVFVCLIFTEYGNKVFLCVVNKYRDIDHSTDIDQTVSDKKDTEHSYTGRRMNVVKHWNKYKKIRKTMNAVSDCSMNSHRHQRSLSLYIVSSARITLSRRIIKTAPVNLIP